MAVNVAVNVTVASVGTPNESKLLTWLNDTLQTDFTSVEQVCTGEAFCQLMEFLFPRSLDLSQVCFQSCSAEDWLHNYGLLQGAFRKVGVVRYIPNEVLMRRDPKVALTFLQWFKAFFEKNNNGRKYDAMVARGGQSVISHSDPLTPHWNQNKSRTAQEPRKPAENPNKKSDVIVLISDDEDDDAVDVTMQLKTVKEERRDVMDVTMEVRTEAAVKEERVDVMDVTMEVRTEAAVKEEREDVMDVTMEVRTEAAVKEEREDVMDVMMEVKTEKAVMEECEKEQLTSTVEQEEEEAAGVDERDQGSVSSLCLSFIRRYCTDNTATDTDELPAILSPSHPDDIIQACSRRPYSLYLYVGVDLGGGRSASVVLIGYFNESSGAGAVRLLHALQMSADAADPRTSADSGAHAADADLLIETLKKICLPLSNLTVFYCNAPHPAASQAFVSRLRSSSPGLVSLCGLSGAAQRACRAGLSASFGCVVDLVREIHYHHLSTSPCVSAALQELFEGTVPYDQSHPVSEQCLFVISTVQKMVRSWKPLTEYFKSQKESEEAARIRAQLMDYKLKLRFLFLSHVLAPLRALQELQRGGSADVSVELRLTSMLVRSYAGGFLRPYIAERFVVKRDPRLLDETPLPAAEVDVGNGARDFLWATAAVDLGEQERGDFMKDAVAFYKAALQGLVESIPKQLGDVALRNIGRVLKNPENVDFVKVPRREVAELAAQLGLHLAGPSERLQLINDYFDIIKRIKEEPMRETGGGHCWAKMLRGIRRHSALHRLLRTLLTLPSSLHSTQVFAKIIQHSEDPPDPYGASPQPGLPVQAANGDKIKEEETSSEDSDSLDGRAEDLDYTDNSSDVVDVTEGSRICRTKKLLKTRSERTPPAESLFIVGDDDDDDEGMVTTGTPPNSLLVKSMGAIGTLVWGQVDGFCAWPAIIIPCKEGSLLPGNRMVEWYGQSVSSQISLEAMKPFAAFCVHFSASSFAVLATYRESILLSLQEASRRCKKKFSVSVKDKDELLKQMMKWAFGGFKPTGPDGFKTDGNGVKRNRPKLKKKLSLNANSSHLEEEEEVDFAGKASKGGVKEKGSNGGGAGETGREDWGGGKGRAGKVQKKKFSLIDGFDDDTSPDFVPQKKRTYTKTLTNNKAASVYTQPDQKLRQKTIEKIMQMKLDIEGFCLCCGTENVEIFHPLFKGSLCLECKDNLTETLYRYDEDGYQSYCTICCYGLEVVLCGYDSCCRSYCADCVNILVGPGTFDTLKEQDPWICYLCRPHQPHYALVPREDWSIRVQGLFANNSAMEFEAHRVYPSIPANQRRPLRVLSLFDGIATGYVVLKDLGFKVEKYVASEVCEDSIAVATVNHDGKIIHVGDARLITEELIEQWGPFDLLIGGSPCNDLSIVNPFRKGLYEGTGRLFFEYYRVLQLLKPKDEDPRPFFWLFENVVFMNTHDKVNICRFLECNPVLVDAVKVSPAHRARCFWGNIPGMSRPITASQNDKLNLQDCLEIGREARVAKVRTITTNPNSLKQGKGVSLLPVLQNGKEDNLWITELEKIFGFPKHYTDVRNMNRQQRQKVLGKAWSVPVIRHLFAPLKDYFACEERPPLTASPSSPSPPASPQIDLTG